MIKQLILIVTVLLNINNATGNTLSISGGYHKFLDSEYFEYFKALKQDIGTDLGVNASKYSGGALFSEFNFDIGKTTQGGIEAGIYTINHNYQEVSSYYQLRFDFKAKYDIKIIGLTIKPAFTPRSPVIYGIGYLGMYFYKLAGVITLTDTTMTYLPAITNITAKGKALAFGGGIGIKYSTGASTFFIGEIRYINTVLKDANAYGDSFNIGGVYILAGFGIKLSNSVHEY